MGARLMMRVHSRLLFFGGVVVFSCALFIGCDDSPSSSLVECTSNQSCPSTSLCIDGVCRRGVQEPLVRDAATAQPIGFDMEVVVDASGCVGEACESICTEACPVGESCQDGECVCVEGARRPCGIKVGECNYGVETCTGGEWDECQGGVQPTLERCDGLDNDCDGMVDEGAFTRYYGDVDGDGWGNGEDTTLACRPPEGYVDRDGDCDDFDRAINPDALDICDGIDNDCDQHIDGLELVVDPQFQCLNQGVCEGTTPSCQGAEGLTCIYPELEFQPNGENRCDDLDNDCDGLVDEMLTTLWYRDFDGDGFGDDDTAVLVCARPGEGFVARGGDCQDDDETIHPDADEICDGVDNNCNVRIDDLDEQLVPAPPGTCPPNRGVCRGLEPVCLGEAGWSCPVERAGYEPNGETLCDGLDNDCDGPIDESISQPCGIDVGVCTSGQSVCIAGRFGPCSGVEGVAPTDDESSIGLCDGLDNDCDGDTDEGCDCLDGDRVPCGSDVGVCRTGESVCFGGRYGPCDGQGPIAEFCDPEFLDHNCDGRDDIEAGLTTLVFDDGDGDGFGSGVAYHQCGPARVGQADRGGDCEDQDPRINPGAIEVCDGIDNDCNGQIDEAAPPADTRCLFRGVCVGTTPTCQGEAGWTCIIASPDYEEEETSCDGLDNDCDGLIDENIRRPCGVDIGVCTTGESVCVAGRFGACSGIQGVLPTDDESSIGLCDGLDNDCDGQIDEGCECQDGERILCGSNVGACQEGERVCQGGRYGPCDGQGPRVEFCDPQFIDHDCDGRDDIQAGLTTLVYDDQDGDGFGGGEAYHQCGPAREGQSARGGDCRDLEPAINPAAPEICDGLDNNCNRTVDEDPIPPVLACVQQGVCRGTIPVCQAELGWACIIENPDYQLPERLCDGLDNDCDGHTDEGLQITVYTDRDEDGFGTDEAQQICGAPPRFTTLRAGDCDDAEFGVNPDAQEVCDGVDNNCQDGIDEGDVCLPPAVSCPILAEVLTGAEVVLSGRGNDPDGGDLQFNWQIISAPEGSTAEILPNNEARGTITPDEPGEYEFELCGIDDEGEQACCRTVLHVEPRCVAPPPAATLSSCSVSWDRRPLIEVAPLPVGVSYRFTIDGAQAPFAVLDTPGQNHFRPAEPLGPGGPPPEGQALAIFVQSCIADDPTCCAPAERVTFRLMETCVVQAAPTVENIIISEYLINGDGGNCPGDGCEAGESIEITNLSHCPVSLDGHHFRYCNNADCTTHRFMDFGPADIVPPRGVYVTVRNPNASTCELAFLGEDDPGLFGLKRSDLVIQSNSTDRSGWFVNSGGGSLRVATGAFMDAQSGRTIALVDPYRGGQANCQSVGFDALDGCGEVEPGTEPATRLLPDQLGRLWHPCDAVLEQSPGGCFEEP